MMLAMLGGSPYVSNKKKVNVPSSTCNVHDSCPKSDFQGSLENTDFRRTKQKTRKTNFCIDLWK